MLPKRGRDTIVIPGFSPGCRFIVHGVRRKKRKITLWKKMKKDDMEGPKPLNRMSENILISPINSEVNNPMGLIGLEYDEEIKHKTLERGKGHLRKQRPLFK
ncbi:hypothetical protein Lal_00006686 [Lupinus albus]|nr:hypothetical protein Lal_00006686 [Lupinus albus]